MNANLQRPEVLSPLGQATLRRLMTTWFDFERRLGRVPLLRRLDAGTFTVDDYRKLLLNLRQQVIEGARWISRAASSFDRDHSDVRSAVLRHAVEEHRDWEALEADAVRAGVDPAEIRTRRRNPGSDALHAYLMWRASEPNPVHLLGAMWIVEGLGQKMAQSWAGRIQQLTQLPPEALSFLRYHGANDERHLDKLYALLDRVCTSEAIGDEIVRTAEVVGRLYAMQLEEVEGG